MAFGPPCKRLLRNSYGFGYFGGLLDDYVPIVAKRGELFFGRFHAPTIPEMGAGRSRLIAAAMKINETRVAQGFDHSRAGCRGGDAKLIITLASRQTPR